MGRKLALLIGTGRYDDSTLRRLEKARADVEDFASVLRDPAIGAFDRVDQLVDPPFGAVYPRLADFLVNADREDLLLLYFSGHGLLDDYDEPYLAVKDTRSDLLSGTGISRTYITAQMDRSRSKQQVLILDCCYSGNLASSSKGSLVAPGAFRGRGTGRVILAAARDDQLAAESDISIPDSPNSVYTHFLINGLRTGAADTDGDGFITVDELHNYVSSEVIRCSVKQTPKRWAEEDLGGIRIAVNPNPSAQLPLGLRDDLDSDDDGKVAAAILKLGKLLQTGDRLQQKAARLNLERLTRHQNRYVSDLATKFVEPEKRGESLSVPVMPSVQSSGEPRHWPIRKIFMAAAALIVLSLASWAGHEYFADAHGLYSAGDIPYGKPITDEGLVRKVGSEVRGKSNRPYLFQDVKGFCAHVDLKPGDLITFEKLCYCPACKEK
jgi:hypothetical protein